MKYKISISAFLFSLLIPVNFIFAVSFSNPYAPIGSSSNPVYVQPSGTFGFSNPYAPIGSKSNPININSNSLLLGF